MNPVHFPLASRNSRRGFALVLVLGFVVLLTVIILAFFSNSLLQRQVAYSSANQAKADLFTQGALDAIVGDLKQEIVDGSTASTIVTGSATNTIYYPTTPANIVPYRAGTDPSWTNLVKRSASGVSFYPASGGYAQAGPSRASNCNTTTASNNGRYYSTARWNQSLLLPPSSTSNFTPNTSTTFTAPDWILVAQDGSNPTAWNVNMKASPLQTSTVLGRYAYCIYDEGGLLDMNVAGYPSTPTDAEIPNKYGESYADLTQLVDGSGNPYISQPQINQIVAWRNAASLQQTPLAGFTPYASYVLSNLTGFLTTSNTALTTTPPGQSDRRFISRQQLLSYFSNSLGGSFALDSALQYLTTFSRDVNAPSWAPSTPTGSTIDYAAQKNATTSANRDTLGVRVTATTFTRPDGTTAQTGEPLLKHRFPLSRLAGLTYQGIDTTDKTTLINGVLSAATAATIQRDFGLVWVTGTHSGKAADTQNADHWNYVGAATGASLQYSIATLAQVASAGREPNFFELLKAAVLSGSLGRDAGANGVFLSNWEQGPASGTQTSDTNVDFQVIQMGANIIDQSDADSYPTEIHFADSSNGNAETAFYGVENLPYIQRVFAKSMYPCTDPTNAGSTQNVGCWYMAEIWNPHQNSGMNATSPTLFKFCGTGLSQAWDWPSSGQRFGNTLDLTQSGSINFTVPISSSSIASPRVTPSLLSNDASYTHLAPTTIVNGPNGPNDAWGSGMAAPPTGVTGNSLAGVVAGIYTGCVYAGDTLGYWPSPVNTPDGGAWGGVAPQGCSLVLECQAPSGGYYEVYQVMRNMTAKQQSDTSQMCYYYTHADPRTDRFGTTLGRWLYAQTPPQLPSQFTPTPAYAPPGACLRTDAYQALVGYDYFPLSSSGFTYASGTTPGANSSIFGSYYMGFLEDNDPHASPTASNPWYSDPDGIVRQADGAYATETGAPYDGRPQTTAYPAISRPIILNRPFRTVGELGYAFRDLPWKSFDFFTTNSADSALLDMFCVNETEAMPGTSLVAGSVNLNTRQAPVLQAIIAGALKDTPTPTMISGGTTSDANTVANAIVSWTTGASPKGPFVNRSDLVTKASSILMGSAAQTDSQVKLHREAALRALSNVGTARTWTLMIDVIAQVGRYPSNATGLSQFVAEGEKRYWLHITIDRYTGQVIDRSMEPVYE